jgi:hypothetical protein
MRVKVWKSVIVLICAQLLACEQQQQKAIVETRETEIQNSVDRAAIGIDDLMTAVIMPNADHIWRSVSYVANSEGVTETKPETDEDWSKLRESAEILIAAGDELRNTNREVFSGDFDEATASFQYTPDEIKQLIADNPEPWQNYIQQMQDRTRMTLQAIDLKDLVGLQDFGAQINGACEGCHADYWYRPPAQQ